MGRSRRSRGRRPRPGGAEPAAAVERARGSTKRFAIIGALLVAALTSVVTLSAETGFGWARSKVTKQLDDDPPLRVRETYRDNPAIATMSSTTWASDRTVGDAAKVDRSAVATLLNDSGAVPVGQSRVRLVLENPRDTSVVVTALRAEITTRAAPAVGTLFLPPDEGGQFEESVRVLFDLDEPGAPARLLGTDGSAPVKLEDGHHLQLGSREQLVLMLEATTRSCTCAWRVVADTVVYDREPGTQVITGGAPLMVTALARRY